MIGDESLDRFDPVVHDAVVRHHALDTGLLVDIRLEARRGASPADEPSARASAGLPVAHDRLSRSLPT